MNTPLRAGNWIAIVACVASLLIVTGCSGGNSGETPGYAKKDFEKTPPPPQYKGPGQPGGPPSGPPPGPPPGMVGGGGGGN